MNDLGNVVFFLICCVCCSNGCPYTNGSIDLTSALPNGHLDKSSLDFCNNYNSATSLILANNSIVSISGDAFDNYYNLEHLDISFNLLQDLPDDVFHNLWKLESLTVRHNIVSRLQASLLKNKPFLVTVNFDHNNISEVEFGFVNEEHTDLLQVYLRHNSLEVFEPWPYQTYKRSDDQDQDFHLEYNKIREIRNPSNWTFTGERPYTVHVYLMFNEFNTIDVRSVSRYFDNSEELLTNPTLFVVRYLSLRLNVTNNPYFCDCSVFWFTHVFRNTVYRWSRYKEWQYRCAAPKSLEGEDFLRLVPFEKLVCNVTRDCPDGCFCQIRPYDGTIFVNCTGASLIEMPDRLPNDDFYRKLVLIFDDNNLKGLKHTSYTQDILNISLDRNQIQTLDSDIVKAMTNLERLNVRENDLREIPKEIQRLDYGNVGLQGNQIRCHCDMLWLEEWMRLARYPANMDLECLEDSGKRQKIVDVSKVSLKCSIVYILTPVLVSVGILIAVSIVVGIFAYRCPYETKVLLYKFICIQPSAKYEASDEKEKTYDTYLSYDHEDYDVRQWVFGELSKKLRKKYKGIRLFNPLIGSNSRTEDNSWQTERTSTMDSSKRIVIVLSEGSFASESKQQYDMDYAEDTLNANPDAEGSLLYILYNKEPLDEIQNEPWLTRLKGSQLLIYGDRLFYAKLFYEVFPGRKGRRKRRVVPATDNNNPDTHNDIVVVDLEMESVV